MQKRTTRAGSDSDVSQLDMKIPATLIQIESRMFVVLRYSIPIKCIRPSDSSPSSVGPPKQSSQRLAGNRVSILMKRSHISYFISFVGMARYVLSFSIHRHHVVTSSRGCGVPSLSTISSPFCSSDSSSGIPSSRLEVPNNNHHHKSVRPLRHHHHHRSISWRLFSTASGDGDAKKRIVFLGTPDVAATSLRTIYEHTQKEGGDCPYEIVGVVTQPPKRRKRKGKVVPSPVGEVADELGIEVLCPEKAKDPDFLERLETEIRPDLCITAAYGQYLPKRFLAIPQHGTVNIHPSLLPKWRGASPVQRSLEAGETDVGVTVLFTVSKMDAGPVIAQKEETVGANDTATTVLPLLFDIGTDCLLDVLPDVLSGDITMEHNSLPQDEALVSNANMIHASEGELKVWEESASVCHNRLRGFSTWPGVYFYVLVEGYTDPIKVKVIESRVLEEDTPREPTTVLEMGPNKKKDGFYLVCGDGSVLEITKVQPAGKKLMDARSFFNGYPGKTFRWVQPTEERKKAKPE